MRISITILLLVFGVALLWLSARTVPAHEILLNQFELNDLDRERDRLSLKEDLFIRISKLSAHLTSLFAPSNDKVVYEQWESVLDYVWGHLPLVAEIVPSEGYYYFKFPHQGDHIAGNLRFTDIEDGRIGLGYYHLSTPRERGQSAMLKDGNQISVSHMGADFWIVRYKGTPRLFKMPAISTKVPPGIAVREGEQFIASMRDESGTPFWVVYKDTPKGFVYLLNTNEVAIEEYTQHEDLLLGQRTKFVFKKFGEGRTVLIAVNKEQMIGNSFYDGPFDQLPARIDLREKFYQVYPYLKVGGIDPFGYFCLNRSTRASVSPYKLYSDLAEVHSLVSNCNGKTSDANLVEHCITFDDKQNFHLSSPLFRPNGELIKGTPTGCEHYVQ